MRIFKATMEKLLTLFVLCFSFFTTYSLSMDLSLEKKLTLNHLEKTIAQQIPATANEQQFITKPTRTKIQELVQATKKAGELRYEILRLENPLKTDLFKNNLSKTRKFAIKGLELFGLRNKYSVDEKNKAQIIVAELEKTKKRLLDTPYPDDGWEKASSHRYYDMRIFDKAIHDQQIITGDALLPYFRNVNQPTLKLK